MDDHFLDLGGNSLRAMQIHWPVLNQVQNDLPMRLMLECTTISEMALLITQYQVAQIDQEMSAQFLAALEDTPDWDEKLQEVTR